VSLEGDGALFFLIDGDGGVLLVSIIGGASSIIVEGV